MKIWACAKCGRRSTDGVELCAICDKEDYMKKTKAKMVSATRPGGEHGIITYEYMEFPKE